MDLKSSKITMASGETDAVLLADATPFPVFCFGDPPLHAMLIVVVLPSCSSSSHKIHSCSFSDR